MERKRILIVTDAWAPQVNGVVRSIERTRDELMRLSHDVKLITPDQFRSVPMPTYKEIRLAVFARRKVAEIIEGFDPHAVHIATEATLGLAARRYCIKNGIGFSTAFHTRYPEYVHARFRVPHALTYRLIRRFHAPALSVMVATRTLKDELEARGFRNIRLWSRGVDVELFHPRPKTWLDLPRPVFALVSRLAVEKNIEAFLSLDLPGSKLVVGDGPQASELRAKFPDAHFVGAKFGEELARYYAAADVFVFPSRTDTFGLVLLEALASGVPVAAFPVPGPLDVVGDAPVGVLDADLAKACRAALTIAPDTCRAHAMRFSWEACTRQFLDNLVIPDFDAFEGWSGALPPAE